jgi:hypothetical protein
MAGNINEYNCFMGACPQCGEALGADQTECPRCDQQTIRVEGQVIPPGASVGPKPKSWWSKPFATALAIAVAADFFQIVFFPMLAQGALSPADDVLDIAVGLAMVKLIGWHWAFLPSFLGKLTPVLDEVPCWTLAVLYVAAERARLRSA